MQVNNTINSQGSANSTDIVNNISQNHKLKINNLFDFSQSTDCVSSITGENSNSLSILKSNNINSSEEINISDKLLTILSPIEPEILSSLISSDELINIDSSKNENAQILNTLSVKISNKDNIDIDLQNVKLPFIILKSNEEQTNICNIIKESSDLTLNIQSTENIKQVNSPLDMIIAYNVQSTEKIQVSYENDLVVDFNTNINNYNNLLFNNSPFSAKSNLINIKNEKSNNEKLANSKDFNDNNNAIVIENNDLSNNLSTLNSEDLNQEKDINNKKNNIQIFPSNDDIEEISQDIIPNAFNKKNDNDPDSENIQKPVFVDNKDVEIYPTLNNNVIETKYDNVSENFQKPVFVDSKDAEIYPILNNNVSETKYDNDSENIQKPVFVVSKDVEIYPTINHNVSETNYNDVSENIQKPDIFESNEVEKSPTINPVVSNTKYDNDSENIQKPDIFESNKVEKSPTINPVVSNTKYDNDSENIQKPDIFESNKVEKSPTINPVVSNTKYDNDSENIQKPVFVDSKDVEIYPTLNNNKEKNSVIETKKNNSNITFKSKDFEVEVPINEIDKFEILTSDTGIIDKNSKKESNSEENIKGNENRNINSKQSTEKTILNNSFKDNIKINISPLEIETNKIINYGNPIKINSEDNSNNKVIIENNKDAINSKDFSKISSQNLNIENVKFKNSDLDNGIINQTPTDLKVEKNSLNLNLSEINSDILPQVDSNEDLLTNLKQSEIKLNTEKEITNIKNSNIERKLENKDEIPKIEYKMNKVIEKNNKPDSLQNDNHLTNKLLNTESKNINQIQNNNQLPLLLSFKSNSYFPKEAVNSYISNTSNNSNKYSTIENFILNNYQTNNETNIKSDNSAAIENNNVSLDSKIMQKIDKQSIVLDDVKANKTSYISNPMDKKDSEKQDFNNNNNSQNENYNGTTLSSFSQKKNSNKIDFNYIQQDEYVDEKTKISNSKQNNESDTNIDETNNSTENKIQLNKNSQESQQLNSLNKILTNTNNVNKSIKNAKDEQDTNQYTAKIYTNEFVKTTFNIISSLPEKASSTAKLILKPASLGTIIVNINLKDKELNIDIRPENKDIVKSIENQIPQLKERLTSVGIQLESININEGKAEQDLAEKKQSKQEQKAKQKEQEILQEYIRSFSVLENEELMD